ncbi:MAG TPA: AI-2E family transporter [Paludibacteraceae bacterium]|nr:AI-2E family transporter [Paludibacteraceae bacterium]HRS67753.1 AI-2E family transporter [Paludibacteraceae bacterium]
MEALKRPYTFDRVVRLVIGLLIVVALLFLINKLSTVLLPFVIGWLIAYLLYPLVTFFQYRLKFKNRILSIFTVLILVTALLVLIGWLFLPSVVQEFSRMGVLLVDYVQKMEGTSLLSYNINQWINDLLSKVDLDNVFTWQNVQGAMEKIMPQFFGLLSSTWNFIIGLFVVFVVLLYVIFILIDYEAISEGFLSIIPIKYRPFVTDLRNDVAAGMNRYFRGQGLVAAVVGVLFAIGFSILGLPLAITMGLFIGLLNLVPYLQTIGFVPVIFLALLQSMETGQSFWLIMLGVFIIFIVVQAVEDLVLMPKIMGKAVGLNPAIILLSLSIWGALFGVIGMIIALPATTLLISYYTRFVINDESLKKPQEQTKAEETPVEK